MIISQKELDNIALSEVCTFLKPKKKHIKHDVVDLKRNCLDYIKPELVSAVAKIAENALPPLNNMGATPLLPPYFLPRCEISPQIVSQKTMIDWLGFSSFREKEVVLLALQCLWPEMVLTASKAGMRGYPQCMAFEVGGVQFGLVGFGAKHGRLSVSLTGVACKTLTTNEQFDMVYQILGEEVLDARLSRLDICLDVYRKEITFDYALWAFDDGQFKKLNAPCQPNQRLLGDKGGRGENLGRTMYIGPRAGEVYGRVYEKGLQIFAKMSEEYREACTERENSKLAEFEQGLDTVADDWLRLEVEFKYKDKLRPMALEMILERDAYFSGAYPFFAKALGAWTGKGRGSLKDNSVICHDKLIVDHRKSYGNHVFTLKEIGYTDSEIVQLLSTGVHNQKLLKSGLFVLERDILAQEMAKIQDFDIPF